MPDLIIIGQCKVLALRNAAQLFVKPNFPDLVVLIIAQSSIYISISALLYAFIGMRALSTCHFVPKYLGNPVKRKRRLVQIATERGARETSSIEFKDAFLYNRRTCRARRRANRRIQTFRFLTETLLSAAERIQSRELLCLYRLNVTRMETAAKIGRFHLAIRQY